MQRRASKWAECFLLRFLSLFLMLLLPTLKRIDAQGLSPSSPSKEYIRFNGQVVATENAIFAQVSVNPSSVSFGSETVQSQTPATLITVTNGGTGATSLALNMGGANASDFPYTTTCTATLAAGSNCSISVSARPSVSGSELAVLSVATAGVTLPISLSVTGTAGSSGCNTPGNNWGFESGCLTPWQISQSTTAISTIAHSGSYGLSIPAVASTNAGAFEDLSGLTPGQAYSVSVWLKASAPTGAILGVSNSQDANWVQTTTTATTNWQQVSQPFTVASDGTLRIHLVAQQGSAITYWDDVNVSTTVLLPTNGGFETGVASPWQVYQPATTAVGTIAHSGTYGLTVPQDSVNQSGALQDIAGLTPGQTYFASAWVKSDAPASVLLFLSNSQDANGVETDVTSSTAWQQVTRSFTVGSDGTLRIHLQARPGSTNVYWDDASLILLPVNGGFETGALGPWSPYQSSTAIGTVAHSGSYGLTSPQSASTQSGALQDLSGLTPGATYTVSAWVKSDSSANVVLFLSNSQDANGVETDITSSTTWQQVSQSFTVANDGTLRIHLQARPGSATVYWDDVSMTQ